MKAQILLLFVLTPLFNYRQNTQPAQIPANAAASQQVSAAYLRQAVAFIKQVKSSKLANPEFILIDSSITLNSNNCLQNVLLDRQFYSTEELKLIKNRVASWRYQWRKTDFPTVNIVRKDTVKSIFKTRARNWEYFYKHVGRDFNVFSMPIFFRSNTYCLFYSGNDCGDLCGEGGLRLYKKEGNHWQLIKSYCEWIS